MYCMHGVLLSCVLLHILFSFFTLVCEDVTCQNGGRCVSTTGLCQCEGLFTGRYCETTIQCMPVICVILCTQSMYICNVQLA